MTTKTWPPADSTNVPGLMERIRRATGAPIRCRKPCGDVGGYTILCPMPVGHEGMCSPHEAEPGADDV